MMSKTKKAIKFFSQIYIGFSILSLGYVSVLSLYNPQLTMNLVSTTLPNTDAISSIRGIYGGVGLVLTLQLIYLLVENIEKALLFLSLFWGAYAISRITTLFADGPLGTFGNTWLRVESVFCIMALALLLFIQKAYANEK